MEQASISTDEALARAARIVRLRAPLLERLQDKPGDGLRRVKDMSDEELRAELRKRGR